MSIECEYQFFAEFNSEELAKVDELLYRKKYQPREIIYFAGEIGNEIYIINSVR